MKDKTTIDKIRLVVLTAAELFDAWRTVPRLLVIGYAWLCWAIVDWYMNLEPFILDGCDMATFADLCIVEAPSTQHAALVTAIVGCAAAVFGLYTNGGRSWAKERFTRWDQTHMQKSDSQYNPELYTERQPPQTTTSISPKSHTEDDNSWDVETPPSQDNWEDGFNDVGYRES